MKTLIKVAIVLIIGVLVYNYFLGTESEKASSEKVFEQVKNVGVSIGELLKEEKQKFADGKYDDAFDKLGAIYENMKQKVSSGERDEKTLKELESKKEKLEKEKQYIEDKLDRNEVDENLKERREHLQDELEGLFEETKVLFEKIMSNKQSDK